MPDAFSYFSVAMVGAIAIATYVLLIGAAHVVRRARNLRFGWTYHVFAGAASILAGAEYAPLIARTSTSWIDPVLPHLSALTLIFAAFPAAGLLNSVLWRRTGQDGKTVEAPRVLADTTGLLLFIAIVLAALQFVYEVKVPGLLAGSGVIAIILGLAMQDLLGNIFGGLAIYLEKSFKPGDWLNIAGTDAQVIEVTWRSTRMVTNDDVLIDVPNSNIVKQTITNYEKPTRAHALHAFIQLDYNIPPDRAKAVLGEATATVPHVLAVPKPGIKLHEFSDSAVVYDIKFWIDDHRRAPQLLSDVRTHAWYAVRRAGMDIAYPVVTLHRPKSSNSEVEARARAGKSLRNHEIFSFLSGEQIDVLVRRSLFVRFASDEHIIEQGAEGNSMFLLVKGRVEVRVARGARIQKVAELGPGDCLGEMSLLTGAPRTATVVALDEVEAVEITHEILAPLIQQAPDVLQRLSELLAARQAANEQNEETTARPSEQQARQENMLHTLRSFFFLGE